ncbi:hypothetical protein BRC68_11460 [Halobacteriales archaeon QH_6_64_20]|nr:MAG: hypothetical protein BRC68_11460 [Halobacteriales archaeon QH_6_64_20]
MTVFVPTRRSEADIDGKRTVIRPESSERPGDRRATDSRSRTRSSQQKAYFSFVTRGTDDR